MALSGTATTNKYSDRYYEFKWSATQNTANNKSTITWELNAKGGSGWYAERTLTVKVNGGTLYSKTNRVERYAGNITSGSFTLNHTSSGDCSFTVDMQVAVYVEAVNLTKTQSFTLNKILRQATLTSAPNFNDTQYPVIYYNNPAGNSVTSLEACISLTGSNDDVPYRAVNKTGTSYTFELTDAELATLRNNTSGNSRTVYFYLKTTIGTSTYYSYLAKTFTIANTDVGINATAYDTNSVTKALTGNNKKIIMGYSNYYCSISAAAEAGSISSITATCGDATLTSNKNTLTGTFNKTRTATIGIIAKDNRGNVGATTVTNELIEYFKPTIGLTVTPTSTDGKMTIYVNGTFFNQSFGSRTNTINASYSISHEGSGFTQSGALTLTKSGNEYSGSITITGLDYKKVYEVAASAYDLLEEVKVEPIRAIGEPMFDWNNNDFKFNVPVEIENSKGLFTYDDEGNKREFLMPCGAYNNLSFNYGSYSSGKGATDIYGNWITLYSKNAIDLKADTTIYANAACTGQFRVDGKLLAQGDIEVAKQTLLHTDTGRYFNEGQSQELVGSNRITKQVTGYILVWQYYASNTVYTENINYTFIPKYVIGLNGGKITLPLAMDSGTHGSKTLYVTDNGTKTTIKGHSKNGTSPNSQWVLKYIIGY